MGWVLTTEINYETRSSYYNVTTRLVELVGLGSLKQILVGKIC